ncbi:MAG TPA: nucleoside deaminase [Candidatus Limnocylindrales bacterium]
MNYELFMGEALAEARAAAERGRPAVGAIAVMDEAMVARGCNRVDDADDPSAHPVLTVLREAARKLGTTRLSDLTVFTTLEPCAMCVGAMLASDAAALVYAAPNPVDGAAGSVLQLAQHPSLGRRIQVVSGIRQQEAEELMGVPSETPTGA